MTNVKTTKIWEIYLVTNDYEVPRALIERHATEEAARSRFVELDAELKASGLDKGVDPADDEAWDAAWDAGSDVFHGVHTNYGGAYLTVGPAEIVVHE